MEHDIGDKSVHVGVADVKKAYLEIGAQPGDTIMMHGSLSSMGTVDGGPKTIFDGMLEACGPCGTVGMATLWFYKADMLEKDFDIATSPSYNGALAEGIRLDPRSVRSNHFSHAVSAIGARAEELTRDHGASGLRPAPWTDRAFALSSPWTRVVEWNALYTFIGVTLRVCTLKHWIEGEIALSFIRKFPPERQQAIRDTLKSLEHPEKPWPWFNIEKIQAELEEQGVVKTTKLGCAHLRGVRTRPLVDYAIKRVLASPGEFMQEQFLQWIDQIEAQA